MLESPRRVAIYVRVSTRDQRLLQQFREVRRMVERRGWTISHVYRERRSGRHGAHRPEWEQLCRDAARKRFGAVAVWAIDRMGRSTLDVLKAVQDFESRGTKLLIVKQKVDTSTPLGMMLLTILAGFAQMERELISERTKAGMAAAKANGRHVGRRSRPVPRCEIDAVLWGEKHCTDVSRDTGISVTTVRTRVREAKREGGRAPDWPVVTPERKGLEGR